MAILYGTQSNGETLPVQVNEFGQLVAQGLPGQEGPPGPEGPMGPVGNLHHSSGSWTPVFGSTDPSAAGHINYDRQLGTWSRYGDLVVVYAYLRTTSVTLTSIRGSLMVFGLPSEAHINTDLSLSETGPFSCSVLHLDGPGRALSGRITYDAARDGFGLEACYSDGWFIPQFSDLQSQGGLTNAVMFSFQGIAADAIRSGPITLDEVM